MENKEALRLQNISVVEDGKNILSGLNFESRHGEIHAVVGMAAHELQNFTDLLAGNFSTYSGKSVVLGEVTGLSEKRKKIDIVESGLNRFLHLTAVENIYLTSADWFRFRKWRERSNCEDLLAKFEIDLDLDQHVIDMSRGDQKLLEFLRTYVKNAPIVVLNEPFQDITKEDRVSALSVLQDMRERGQSIIFLTSHLEDALHISDRISVLDSGRISMTTATKEVIRDPKEVMYLLSGWAPLQGDRAGKELDILQTIVNARSILSSTSELRKELLYLARDIAKVLSAKNCVIYLINEEANSVVETVDEEGEIQRIPRLKSATITKLVRERKLMRFTREDDSKLFEPLRGDDSTQTVICMPIDHEDQVCGMIQVSYVDDHKISRSDELYLTTFSREISIAIETSALIGRSMLLQESHHRIKNNLQMITSMIYMQKLYYRENGGDVEAMFDSTISRISSIAAVHDLLAKDKAGGSIVNLNGIIKQVVRLYQHGDVEITLDVENISIPYNKATSISLVVNELISNCMKHAFRRRKDNCIAITCTNDGKNIRLEVADNGWGIPADKVVNHSGSIGMSMAQSVVKSMRGTIEFLNQNGTTVRIMMPTVHVYDARNSKV